MSNTRKTPSFRSVFIFGTLVSGTLMSLIVAHWFYVQGLLSLQKCITAVLIGYSAGAVWSVLMWFPIKHRVGLPRDLKDRP